MGVGVGVSVADVISAGALQPIPAACVGCNGNNNESSNLRFGQIYNRQWKFAGELGVDFYRKA